MLDAEGSKKATINLLLFILSTIRSQNINIVFILNIYKNIKKMTKNE